MVASLKALALIRMDSKTLPNIFLVGPMGSGKSSIGRQLAALCKHRFFDSDKEIQDRTGADIPWIFDVEGEEGFRDREQAMLAELCEHQGIVLATGGGSIKREANRTLLQNKGVVVYLDTSVEEQIKRTSRDKNRPLLQTEDPAATLKALMEERRPLYLDVAHISVNTNRRNLKDVANEIIKKVKSLPN